MAPWEPEHAEHIRKELAKMEIDKEGSSFALKATYEQKMKDHNPVEEALPVEEVDKPKRKYIRKTL